MTHEKVRYFDFAAIDAIFVSLNLPKITTQAFATILLALFAQTFLDRANYYYHKSYAGFAAAPILFSFCARCMASCYGNIDIYIYNVDAAVV